MMTKHTVIYVLGDDPTVMTQDFTASETKEVITFVKRVWAQGGSICTVEHDRPAPKPRKPARRVVELAY